MSRTGFTGLTEAQRPEAVRDITGFCFAALRQRCELQLVSITRNIRNQTKIRPLVRNQPAFGSGGVALGPSATGPPTCRGSADSG